MSKEEYEKWRASLNQIDRTTLALRDTAAAYRKELEGK